MNCPKCGKEIANDSQFCKHCGTQIERDSNRESTTDYILNVRWFLLLAIVLISATNPLFFEIFERYEFSPDANIWALVPGLSLIVAIISIILSAKKKLHFISPILMGIIFCLNLTIVFIANDIKSPDYSLGEYINVTVKGENWHSGFQLKSDVDGHAEYHAHQIDSLLNWNRIEKHAYISCKESKIYPVWKVEKPMWDIIFIEALLIIIYFIYAIIARKKGLQY